MKKSILFGTLFSAMVIFAGCDHKCPAADTSILDWFPYENGQTFALSDINFSVDDIVFDHQDGWPRGTDCGVCSNDFSFSVSALNLNINFRGYGTSYTQTPTIEDLYIDLRYNGVTEYFEFDGILRTDPGQAVFRAKNPEQFYKSIVITKGIGITEIETETGTLSLQNPEQKPNTKDKVMKIRSC